jgi:hypothetical protein
MGFGIGGVSIVPIRMRCEVYLDLYHIVRTGVPEDTTVLYYNIVCYGLWSYEAQIPISRIDTGVGSS